MKKIDSHCAFGAPALIGRRSIVGLTAGLLAWPAVYGQTPVTLKVIVFPGGFNWPLWVAQARGLLARQGLDIQVTPTPNSTFQMKGLIDGDFDIAMTAFDNVVAYNSGQGEVRTDQKSDLAAFMGADGGFLRLVAAPGIDSIEQLKGRKVAVDALTTGYAFVLREMLERKGLRSQDVEFVRAGGVSQRFAGLLRGEFDATLLVSPFESQAQARGFRVLARAPDVLDAYQGVVAAARREWLKSQPKQATGFVKALAEAVDWLKNDAHRDEAVAILRQNLSQLSSDAAQATYDTLLKAPDGFQRGGTPNAAGLATVLRLRGKFTDAEESRIGSVQNHFDSGVLQALK